MPPKRNSQPWTGLKGKPESASMAFLIQQNSHRFPGPGYNTWHSRVLKEEQGHLRLIRDKINDYFAHHDEADSDPALQGPLGKEGVGNKNNKNISTQSNNQGGYKPGEVAVFDDTRPISAARERPASAQGGGSKKPAEIDEDLFQ